MMGKCSFTSAKNADNTSAAKKERLTPFGSRRPLIQSKPAGKRTAAGYWLTKLGSRHLPVRIERP